MVIRTVWGDNLPAEVPSYPAIDIAQQLPSEVDAVLISKDMLYQAQEDTILKLQLQSVARQTILLIYGAMTRDIANILEIQIPNVTDTTARIVLVAVWDKDPVPMAGAMLIPIEPKTDFNFSREVDNWVRTFQKYDK